LPKALQRRSGREQGPVELALADYRSQSSGSEFAMQWHRNCDGSGIQRLLHDAVAAFLPDGHKTMIAK
jgi:hypothetical protein